MLGFSGLQFEGIANVRCLIIQTTSWCSVRGARTGMFCCIYWFMNNDYLFCVVCIIGHVKLGFYALWRVMGLNCLALSCCICTFPLVLLIICFALGKDETALSFSLCYSVLICFANFILSLYFFLVFVLPQPCSEKWQTRLLGYNVHKPLHGNSRLLHHMKPGFWQLRGCCVIPLYLLGEYVNNLFVFTPPLRMEADECLIN